MPCENSSVASRLRFCRSRSALIFGSSVGPSTPWFQLWLLEWPSLVVLAIGLVVLVVVRDQIVQREAVMGGDEIDAGPRPASALLEEVADPVTRRRKFRQLALVALPIAPHGIAIAVVPLRPAGREAADLIAAGADVPGLGDQLDPRQDGVLAAGVEEAAALVEAMRLAAQDRRQIEAEAIHLHLRRPSSEGCRSPSAGRADGTR